MCVQRVIDSPFLMQQHLSLQNPSFLVQKSSVEYFTVDPHTLPSVNTLNVGPIEYPEFSKLVGTHHGVVCLFNSHNRNLLLWNPSIRKFSSPIHHPSLVDFGLPEATVIWSCYGFWIDPSTKEFKIVALIWIYDDGVVRMVGFLYTSIRHDWRVIQSEWKINLCPQASPLMIQGVAHWTVLLRKEAMNVVILSFDFELERFDPIDIPVVTKLRNLPIKFVLQGNLALLIEDQHRVRRYNMYVRKQGSWVTMSSFDISGEVNNVLWVMRKEEEEEEEEERVRALVLRKPNSELGLYETTAGFIPLMDDLSSACVVNEFVESLVFPY